VPVEVVDELPTGATPVRLVAGGVEAAMHTGGVQAVDRARLERQLRQAEDQVKLFTDKLANPGFMKAPPHVVEGARRSLAEAEAQRDTVRRLLDGG